MTAQVGAYPGRIYTQADYTAGVCPQRGARIESGNSEYVLCEVAASQNLINGHLVFIGNGTSPYHVTIAAVTTALTAANNIGVAFTNVVSSLTTTASASMFIWVQIKGPTLLRASLSALPFVPLKIGNVAGAVDDDIASASNQIDGIHLTATSNLAFELCAAILSYPRYAPSTLAG